MSDLNVIASQVESLCHAVDGLNPDDYDGCDVYKAQVQTYRLALKLEIAKERQGDRERTE